MANLSARSILAGTASGPIIAAGEALSFWAASTRQPAGSSTCITRCTARRSPAAS